MKRDEVINVSTVVLDDINALHNYLDNVQGKKNYSEFPEMHSNPFICLLSDEIKIKWIKKGNSKDTQTSITKYCNEETGESVDIRATKGTAFYDKKYVDARTFTKIYKKNLKEMFSLSSSALKLFGYFIGELDFKDKEGMVYMSLQDGINFCEYGENSKSLVYRGLIELIQKGFICKTERPWTFYINPKYIHNGDSIAVFKQYIKDPSDNKDNSNTIELENW